MNTAAYYCASSEICDLSLTYGLNERSDDIFPFLSRFPYYYPPSSFNQPFSILVLLTALPSYRNVIGDNARRRCKLFIRLLSCRLLEIILHACFWKFDAIHCCESRSHGFADDPPLRSICKFIITYTSMHC